MANEQIYYYNLSTNKTYHISNITRIIETENETDNENIAMIYCMDIQYAFKEQKLYLIFVKHFKSWMKKPRKFIYTLELIRNYNLIPLELLSIIQSYIKLNYYHYRIHFNIYDANKERGNIIDFKLDNKYNLSNVIYLHERSDEPYQFYQINI